MSEKFPLEGKVAIVTGAGRGIGREHALAFARAGAIVIVNDKGGADDGSGGSNSIAADVAAEIRAFGGNAVTNSGDVADKADSAELVRQAIDSYGKLDILVNNAGILRDRSLVKMAEEDWDEVLRVHLRGTFLMTQAAAQYWRQRAKAGERVDARVINTSSGSGLFGNFGQANYAAAKGGIASLTIVTALELSSYGVTANAIAPVAKTRLTATAGMSQEFSEGFDPYDPRHVSPLVVWLASERSADVTGRIFNVVGGFVGVVEGYNVGPELAYDRPLTFEEIDAELPDLIAQSKARTLVHRAHAYSRD